MFGEKTGELIIEHTKEVYFDTQIKSKVNPPGNSVGLIGIDFDIGTIDNLDYIFSNDEFGQYCKMELVISSLEYLNRPVATPYQTVNIEIPSLQSVVGTKHNFIISQDNFNLSNTRSNTYRINRGTFKNGQMLKIKMGIKSGDTFYDLNQDNIGVDNYAIWNQHISSVQLRFVLSALSI
jgi:hypothetical protein